MHGFSVCMGCVQLEVISQSRGSLERKTGGRQNKVRGLDADGQAGSSRLVMA